MIMMRVVVMMMTTAEEVEVEVVASAGELYKR